MIAEHAAAAFALALVCGLVGMMIAATVAEVKRLRADKELPDEPMCPHGHGPL